MKIEDEKNIWWRLSHLNWGLIAMIFAFAGIGFASLYSAAGGDFSPWASRQMLRFVVGLFGMVVIAVIDVRWWFKLAWPLYFLGLLLLVAVEVMGHIGMGAQRWINLGFIRLQPSEIMKISVILVLARYYHMTATEYVRQWQSLIMPAAIIGLPVMLVMLQPDLGTALMIIMAGGAMVFIAGAPLWWFGLAGGATLAAIPVAWNFMHSYQKQRVLTFLNPESDPLGAGYHITQSKIAIGSGGWSGKGFLEGSQSRLNFLPEKQTDFIFTLWAEEWGFIGGVCLLALSAMIFIYCIWIATSCRYNFGRYLALGLAINFSLYIFINIAMVMGLIPVVGVPLPMVSYGGTAMLASLISFGLIMSCYLSREGRMGGY